MPEDKELMELVQTEVEQMPDAELQAEAKKLMAAAAKRKEYRTVKTPEQQVKAKAYRAKKYAKERAILAAAKAKGLVA